MDREEQNANPAFAAHYLHSPPPISRRNNNWDDPGPATDIPLHETSGSPHVGFAAKSPSIIPSPVYAESSTGYPSPSPAVVPPPMPMHVSTTTSEYTSTNPRNFGVDTFQTNSNTMNNSNNFSSYNDRGGEKTAVEDMGQDLYRNTNANTNEPAYYGDAAKSSLRSDGFMRLESGEEDLQQQQYNNRAYQQQQQQQQPPPQMGGTSYPPYLQQPMDSADKRNLGMRLLLGPVRRPWFSWLSGLAMLIVLVVELIKNSQMTGSVISTSPTFNPLIGPSFPVSLSLFIVKRKILWRSFVY